MRKDNPKILGRAGQLNENNYRRQQADADVTNEPGRFDPKTRDKKPRYRSILSFAATAASTAYRPKRPTQRSESLGPSHNELPTFSTEPRSANTTVHGARNLIPPPVLQIENQDFVPKDGYTFDATRGAYVRDRDRDEARDSRNFDSFGSTSTQPGSTFLHEHDEDKPVALTVTDTNDFAASDRMELTSIENCILRAKLIFPELDGPKHESTEEAVIRFVAQYESISAPLRDSKGRLDKADKMKKDLYRTEDDLRDAKAQYSRLSRDYKELKTEISRLQSANDKLVSSHGVELRKEQASKDQLKSMLEGQLRKARDDSKLKDKTINDRDTQIKQERADWHAFMKRLEGDKQVLESRLESALTEYESRLKDVEAKSENRFARERAKYDDLIASLESQIAQLKSEAQEQLFTQKQLLIKEHEAESVALRNVIEEFKVASTQREHFKGLTDRDVAGHFLRLANDIEDFSRLGWEFRKEQDWPLTEDQMRQFNPKNTRKLKQQIVQNTMWVILYQHVFRSPFRILGEDGKDIDEDWIEIYAPDASTYEWPSVPPELERSRYESAKAFLGAIEPSATKGRLRVGYEEAIKTAVNAVCRALEKVAIVEARERKILEGILRLSAKIWLEFCSQRYRLMVVLSKGSGDILTSMGTDNRTLSLIVRPDLKRYGDSQGRELERGESVTGWKSLVESYPS
ncbi:Nn.00g050530.m01.CDS01 [Neocucurbitaria sp. VM-36]